MDSIDRILSIVTEVVRFAQEAERARLAKKMKELAEKIERGDLLLEEEYLDAKDIQQMFDEFDEKWSK